MWSPKIKPYVGVDNDKEPFDEWFSRISKHIPNIPKNVAEHWIYRHYGHSPYEHFPIDQLSFELQSWPIEQLYCVSFGDSWGTINEDFSPEYCKDPLFRIMLDKGTWPHPIIVLNNHNGIKNSCEKPLSRLHLIEGHRRLTYLRHIKSTAKPIHDVWVMTVSLISSETISSKPTAQKEPRPNRTFNPQYAHEKLSLAVKYLAIYDYPIKDRLDLAYKSGIAQLKTDDFPLEKRESWKEVLDMKAKLSSVNSRAASHFAREILEFYEWTCYKLGRLDGDKKNPSRF